MKIGKTDGKIDETTNEKFPLIHWNSAQLKFHHIQFILYDSNDMTHMMLFQFSKRSFIINYL